MLLSMRLCVMILLGVLLALLPASVSVTSAIGHPASSPQQTRSALTAKRDGITTTKPPPGSISIPSSGTLSIIMGMTPIISPESVGIRATSTADAVNGNTTSLNATNDTDAASMPPTSVSSVHHAWAVVP